MDKKKKIKGANDILTEGVDNLLKGDEKFEQSKEEKFEHSKKKLFTLVYRHNRSHDAHIGREVLKFAPHGINPWHPAKYKSGVPQEVIDHPDFQAEKNDFLIKE